MAPRMKTIVELRRELRAKERVVSRLLRIRRKLAGKLSVLDRRIAALGGEVTSAGAGIGWGRGGKRRAGKRRRATGKPLVEYIQAVLARSKGGMRARDVMKAVKRAGYPTFSKSFYGIVAAALRETSKFKRLARGVYTLAK